MIKTKYIWTKFYKKKRFIFARKYIIMQKDWNCNGKRGEKTDGDAGDGPKYVGMPGRGGL